MNDSVLVIGGGAGGLRAALDAADKGAQVTLVEKKAIIGGCMASHMVADSDEDGPAQPADLPTTLEVMVHENIEVLTLAEVTGLEGAPGDFTATVRQRARYVTDACTQCNKCRLVCPVVRSNEYESGMVFRKAIFSPIKDGMPDAYVIDIEDCLNEPPNYLPCQRCVEVCEDDCIFFDMPAERVFDRTAGSIVVAVGFDYVDAAQLKQYGYGAHPDVLTSAELDRLLTGAGPTGGFVEKPSNEECPETLLMVVGEGAPLSWSSSASHIEQLVAQDIKDITVLYSGNGTDEAKLEALRKGGQAGNLTLVPGELERVLKDHHNTLRVRYMSQEADQVVTQEFDMIVLTAAVEPPEGLGELAQALGIDLAESGFVKTTESQDGAVGTSRPGVLAVGCASGSSLLDETLAQGRAAAVSALKAMGGGPLPKRAAAASSGPRSEATTPEHPLTENELQEKLENFVWGLVALGQNSRPGE